MTGIGRLLSKRDKQSESPSSTTRKRISMYLSPNASTTVNKSTERVDPNSVCDFYGLFSDTAKPKSDEESKIKALRHRIITSKSVLVKDDNILWSLRCNFSKGDADSAYDLLAAMTDASEGIIIPYSPETKLLGAINRQAVTCFLDATLFAMFSRLDSFEAMLYNTFDDKPRNRLAFLLRLWVNLLRAGKLITTDITKVIQESLLECGWADAGKVRQQDASEAFTFITEKLKLPLLTLKMDMYHAGKHDDDDHRFINERLLEVAIPANENGEQKDIKLEDCLEEYFNNRIEVRRFLERRSTINAARSPESTYSKEKAGAIHVEALEVEDVDSPLTPISSMPSYVTSNRPGNRARTTSIIQERFVPDKDDKSSDGTDTRTGRLRKGSVRKEVLMPAWQFFSLIPWYTNNAPATDAQVATHFSTKRPILGLCLKRYSMTREGRTIRLNTMIDIPVEIGLPHFIQDDKMTDSGALYGNFKLSLQSCVCHRGHSVDSGHYISLVRATPTGSTSETDSWMRFDDLATQKITYVDINKALHEETPYLLFYQITPIDNDSNMTTGSLPPSYTDSQLPDSSELSNTSSGSPEFDRSVTDSLPPSGRPSFDLPILDDHRATIMPSERRRPSAELNANDFRRFSITPNGTTPNGTRRPSAELGAFDFQRFEASPNGTRRPSSVAITGALQVSKSRSNSQDGRRKSASISRSLSRGSKRMSLAFANITGTNKDKDERPMSIIPEPTASVESMGGGTPDDALAALTGQVPAKAMGTHDVTEPEHKLGREHGKEHKRNKRLTKLYNSSKPGEHPDRECSVM